VRAPEKEKAMRMLAVVTLVTITALPAVAQMGNPAGMSPRTPESEPGKPAPHQPNTQDRLFIFLAGTGGLAEVATARTAQEKASNGAVKDFARRMAQEHSKGNEALAPLAKAASIPLPEAPTPDHEAQQAELDKLSGAEFDLRYMQAQIVDHQKMSTILQWEISQGQDAALQRYAMEQLPAVFEHLEMAQRIVAQLTGATPQGLAASSAASRPTSASRTQAQSAR
jgi:putative membrane protein